MTPQRLSAVLLAPAASAQTVPSGFADLANHRADPDAPLTAENARQMAPAWHIQTETPVTHDPVVEGDRVFFLDALATYLVWLRRLDPEDRALNTN